MAVEQFANNASSTLNGAIISSDTSLTVNSASTFPTSGNFRIIIDSEIIIVGSVSSNTFSNLTRGAEGTTAASHSNGVVVTHLLTSASFQQFLQGYQLVNEFRNFPKYEGALSTLPFWWQKSASATVTDVAVSGESGITETYARSLKVVTTVNGHYAAQRFTYADEPRLKSGRTASMIVAVWSVGSVAARIRLQSSVGSLGVSSDTTTAGWTILSVNGVTLNGTYVEPRFEVDNGTAYFVPLGMNIGPYAIPLPQRKGVDRYKENTDYITASAVADPNTWTDADLTTATSPLAFMAEVTFDFIKANASGWDIYERGKGSSGALRVATTGNVNQTVRAISNRMVLLDDSQIMQYNVDRWTGANTGDWSIHVFGYREWE